jgi:hypothetical protein
MPVFSSFSIAFQGQTAAQGASSQNWQLIAQFMIGSTRIVLILE